jgi:hypothetical protein
MGWGFLGDIADAASDAVSDVGSAVADVASDVGEGLADAAVAVGEGAVDVAGNAGGYLGDAVGFATSAADTFTFGGASAILDAVDNTVLDGVDYVTGGVIDIDIDNGTLSANVGIDGVAEVGASIGEHGVTASADAVVASTDLAVTDQGLQFDSSGGIDVYPLPSYSGHMQVSPDGEVAINGHVQGTVPTPYGLLSGSADGGFVRTDQGWGTYIDADGTLLLPSGTSIAAGINAGYMESGDNSSTTFGAYGSVTEPGVGTVGGSFGYQSTTQDGVTVTQQTAEAHAAGFGAQVQASENYIGIDTPEGSISQTTTDFEASGPSVDALEHLADNLLGDDITNPTAGAAPAAAAEAAEAAPGTAAQNPFEDDITGMSNVPTAPPADAMAAAAPGYDADAPDQSVVGDMDPTWSEASADAPVDPAAPVDQLTQADASADQMQQDANEMFDDIG